MYLHWTNDRFISTKISRLSVADILPSINSAHYQKGQSVADYHWLFLCLSDEEKDVVSVDGTEVYAKSHEEDLTKEGGEWSLLIHPPPLPCPQPHKSRTPSYL